MSPLLCSQRIGEAYQILSDPQLRAAYDTRGKEAVDSAPKMDAGTVPYSTVQYSTVQYSTVHYSAAHYSAAH
jgi:DnaJ-class molecular chaperone